MSFPKSEYTPEGLQAEFRKGIENAQNTVGDDRELSLVPPSLSEEEILAMPLEEIQNRFARRYKIFVELLSEYHHLESGETRELSEEKLNEFRKWLIALNSLDTYIKNHNEGTEVTLKERQIDVFDDVRNFIEAGETEGYVKIPTGVGKTVLFIELVEALNMTTLIVVPRQLLVEQTEHMIQEFAPDLEVGKVYTKAKEFGRKVTIITYDSFVTKVKTGDIKPEDYDCLILDEVHESLSLLRSDTVKRFDKAVKIGFTATPDYSEEKKVANFLQREIHSMSIKEAVEEGLLCSLTSIVAKTQVDLSQLKIQSNGEYSERQLERYLNIYARNKAAIDLYKKAFFGELALAYCVGVKHAKVLAKMYCDEGIPAMDISATTPNKKEILQKFHSGEIKVLCNADLLITGFDEKKATVCLNLRPTHSKVIAEQRGGRVLRSNEKKPGKMAYVIDFIDSGISDEMLPILFSEVAGEPRIVSKKYSPREEYTGGSSKGGEMPDFSTIEIEGLELVTDVSEILKIINTRSSEKIESNFLSFVDLQKEVRSAGIKNMRDYWNKYNKHQGWPFNPDNIYPEWESWYAFLGKEKKDILSYEVLMQEVRSAGIKNSRDYEKKYQEHEGWPSAPYQVLSYASKWRGWNDFLGKTQKMKKVEDTDGVLQAKDSKKLASKSIRKKFPSWDEFVSQVGIFNILEEKEYRKLCKDKGWPPFPEDIYSEWPGWNKFFRIKK